MASLDEMTWEDRFKCAWQALAEMEERAERAEALLADLPRIAGRYRINGEVLKVALIERSDRARKAGLKSRR